MERKDFFANKFRSAKKSGNELPSLTNMLSKQHIDYDRVEALLEVEPDLISNLKCSIEGNGLRYEVPEGLHRDIQACNLRAVSIICLALSENDFSSLTTKLSRRKKGYLSGIRTRFQSAKQSIAAA